MSTITITISDNPQDDSVNIASEISEGPSMNELREIYQKNPQNLTPAETAFLLTISTLIDHSDNVE